MMNKNNNISKVFRPHNLPDQTDHHPPRSQSRDNYTSTNSNYTYPNDYMNNNANDQTPIPQDTYRINNIDDQLILEELNPQHLFNNTINYHFNEYVKIGSINIRKKYHQNLNDILEFYQ